MKLHVCPCCGAVLLVPADITLRIAALPVHFTLAQAEGEEMVLAESLSEHGLCPASQHLAYIEERRAT